MDERGPARIEALCATKAAAADNREVDETNSCRCEGKGQLTRSVAQPARPQMDKRGFARIEKPFTSKDTGDDNCQFDGKNGCRCEGKGQQTRSALPPSPVVRSRPRQTRMLPITGTAG